jgi:hypothetical protein
MSKQNRKIIYIGSILIIIFIIIFLNYQHRLTIDVNNIESITFNITEANSNKTTTYKPTFTDKQTIEKIATILNKVTYKKATYSSDIIAFGLTGYSLELKEQDGTLKIIRVYYDDTIRVQSNGRYNIETGLSQSIYEELLALCKTFY